MQFHIPELALILFSRLFVLLKSGSLDHEVAPLMSYQLLDFWLQMFLQLSNRSRLVPGFSVPGVRLSLPADVQIALHVLTKLLKSLWSFPCILRVEAAFYLLNHHIKHLVEVFFGRAHVPPCLVQLNHTVAEELLKRVFCFEEHLVV